MKLQRLLNTIGTAGLILVSPINGNTAELRILADRPPETLNPRNTLDGTSQRMSQLLYRALTRLNNLQDAEPDLAKRFYSTNDNKIWHFELNSEILSEQQTISGDQLLNCFENYLKKSPKARIISGFSGWYKTEYLKKSKKNKTEQIIFYLNQPDPYLPRNVSLLRYFEIQNETAPCIDPKNEDKIISSGDYRIKERSAKHLILEPKKQSQLNTLHFIFIRDETARTLALLQNKGDAIQNNLPLTKADWLKKHYSERFHNILWRGVNVSYLAFNLNDPILSRQSVRKAIALSLNIQDYIHNKLLDAAEPTSELLAPSNAEYSNLPIISFNVTAANQILDQAGFLKNPETGIRFELKYRTTPVREGLDLAKWIQLSLSDIGIDVKIETVEPGIFLTSIRKGKFQLYSSRWIGVADASLLYRTLHSDQNLNRWGYQSKKMDAFLMDLLKSKTLDERKKQTQIIQKKVLEDLPFFPLLRWKNGLILSKEWDLPSTSLFSVSGDFYPLAELKRNKLKVNSK